jgi:hypothetical protein
MQCGVGLVLVVGLVSASTGRAYFGSDAQRCIRREGERKIYKSNLAGIQLVATDVRF